MLGDRVRFLGWVQDLPALYGAIDVVALTSRSEGTPVALIEAAASGTPVVATGVGGVPDVVRDRETGLLVPPRDPVAVAAQLVTLLEDPQGARRMGEEGALGARPLLPGAPGRRPHPPLPGAAGALGRGRPPDGASDTRRHRIGSPVDALDRSRARHRRRRVHRLLCRRLVADGAQVVGLDDLSTGSLENLRDAPEVDLVQADLVDEAAVAAAARGCRAIFHHGAKLSVPWSMEFPGSRPT